LMTNLLAMLRVDLLGGHAHIRIHILLQSLASKADIKFDFHVKTHWQPINSQRMLLWASR
jgi:hypothetical protein